MRDVVIVQSPEGPAAWLTAIGTLALAFAAVGVAWWERRTGKKQLDEERGLTRKREQLAEAYRVQVVLAEKTGSWGPGPGGGRSSAGISLVAIVRNHGAHTITKVEGAFRLGGGSGSVVFPGKTEWLSGYDDLPELLRGGLDGPPDYNPCSDRLAPWDAGIRFQSDEMAASRVPGAFPMVRWTDRWLTRWEYRQGEVRQIEDGAVWKP